MAVYYQARSSEEINRHHLESKCPNIMKGRRTKAQWNMWHFMILKTSISAIAVYLFILPLSSGFSKFVYIYGVSMCVQLFILSCFFWVLIICRKHAALSALPKEFSLQKDRGSAREPFDLSLCGHSRAYLLCFHLSRFILSSGWEPHIQVNYTSCFLKILEFSHFEW